MRKIASVYPFVNILYFKQFLVWLYSFLIEFYKKNPMSHTYVAEKKEKPLIDCSDNFANISLNVVCENINLSYCSP